MTSTETSIDLTGRSGVITGAGSGIGRALAEEFGARGAHLLLVGRREQALRETASAVVRAGGTAEVLAVDITAEGSVEKVADVARTVLGRVDLLVNNAGNVRAGRLEDCDPTDVLAMVSLNLTAPILLTRALLPDLRAAAEPPRRSIVLDIASGIALVPLPFYTTYAATKTGLAAFGHALRRELHGTGVHVASGYLGAMATAMMDSSTAGEDLGFGRRSVQDVVTDLVDALGRGEHEINTSLPSRRAMQRLHATDPLAVDADLAPRLTAFESAVRDHRSI
ncbi:SDR family NAD(P)-dependent oxidoreductase [Pseudonocardia spinosispora]|uniref:SDR family NAD(P)-dependent oxidoreductase n=1 Tax=Pseudonocardia spinosispora TaxID=103441 RepID=UPI000414D705|nr:SDR family NAD(P)-dependent oxidoreductase [Pseudonocardia spinosispora]